MGVGFRAGMLMILYMLVRWLDCLLLLGPSYGYFSEPRKSYLMVAPHKVSLASDVLLVWGYLLSLVTPFLGVLLVSLNIVRS